LILATSGRQCCLDDLRLEGGAPLGDDGIQGVERLELLVGERLVEQGSPISVHGWQKLVERIGQHWNSWKGTDLKVHAHMLRHACGFALANAGHDTRAIQDYLGHKSIQHTVRYTELSSGRFKNFWK
jgi:integrase